MELNRWVLMLMPILTPGLEANDFDLIWFAVMLTVNMEVGLITPSVGLNLYVLKAVAPQVPLPEVLKGSFPLRGHHARLPGDPEPSPNSRSGSPTP
jgi:C4-dicarboxylate transporter DctM subunit